ncbi:MAG TPA: alkaline phosphatase family protein, partial [Planctomycetota bacterium]|nr:alkaline phosphatase family protein [Planctomycetota bacterium]
MSDLDRVKEWLGSGVLVAPSSDVTNFVDLTRALLRLGGAEDLPTGEGDARLVDRIGPAEHLVFVLVDGLGADFVRMLPADTFLKQRLDGEVRSVFMSTTACALTTLATAQWPAVHGVPG